MKLNFDKKKCEKDLQIDRGQISKTKSLKNLKLDVD